MARVETTERSAREAARARRAAQARGGKKELKGSGSASTSGGVVGSNASRSGGSQGGQGGGDARSSARERRRAMAHQGKAALKKTDRSRVESRREEPEPAVEETPAEPSTVEATGPEGESCPPGTSRRRRGGHCEKSSGHLQARARRRALADRGKAAETSGCLSAAQVARQSNPDMSGREIARRARAEQAKNGARGRSGEDSTSRRRKMIEERRGGSADAPWKVGASETTHGQEVTGTQVNADADMTGWEAGACTSVTGTEYLAADLFQDLCRTDLAPSPMRSGVSRTGHGGRVTGNEVGRGERVTGNEPGTCQSVTGTEYLGTEQFQGWCGTTPAAGPALTREDTTMAGERVTGDFPGRSSRVTGDERGVGRSVTGTQYLRRATEEQGRAPARVEQATTLRGGGITGSRVGRSERVTGDEPGSCRNVTGNDYVGREQFQEVCGTEPPRQAPATRFSATDGGLAVSGARSGRGSAVTGNEPGTCQAVTGTPYMGAEEYRNYCAPEDQARAASRQSRPHATPAHDITGQQPGLNNTMTGADDGACQAPTGTPYVGREQYAEACKAEPATPGSPDFPQSLEEPVAPAPSAEPPAAHAPRRSSAVTGSRYEGGSGITGPFGMAEGKVTGTETARHEGRSGFSYTPDPAPQQARPAPGSRVTGEGSGSGPSITGDDWDRGERVTGTEGTPARRNPSWRGPAGSVMPMQRDPKRNEEVPLPESPVTGSSGSTEKGAAVTYSGGARG